MKTLALALTLLLHSTGLWPHLSDHARTSLAATATAGDTVATTSLAALPLVPTALPVQTGAEPLKLAAGSAYAIDASTGTVLFSQNAAQPRPIASITKLATVIVALSHHRPADAVRIPELPTYGPDDETIGLQAGETYTVGDLVRAALIQSANDAADALARFDSGTEAKFAAAMNLKAAEWGIGGTHFTSATGLKESSNTISATAIAQIARLALTNDFIRQTVSASSGTITSTAGRTLNLATTNDLLASGKYYGIKTGYTPAAGECFVGLTRINDHDIITVVLGADDRFGTTETLRNWIGRNWQWL